MKSKVNEAVDCFNKGFNCSQAILSTYCEQFGLDKTTALKLSCGLGGGMGRLGETCGAVSAAYLLIGLKYGKYEADDNKAKDKTYELVRDFQKRFSAQNNSTICRELLGLDLMINNDRQKEIERVNEICPVMVKNAAEILESILY